MPVRLFVMYTLFSIWHSHRSLPLLHSVFLFRTWQINLLFSCIMLFLFAVSISHDFERGCTRHLSSSFLLSVYHYLLKLFTYTGRQLWFFSVYVCVFIYLWLQAIYYSNNYRLEYLLLSMHDTIRYSFVCSARWFIISVRFGVMRSYNAYVCVRARFFLSCSFVYSLIRRKYHLSLCMCILLLLLFILSNE